MADNVVVVSGTVVAADEINDGTLGSCKVQYVKLMDGTPDGTTKASVGANGLSVNASQNGAWSVSVTTLASAAPSGKATAPGLGNFISDGSGWVPAINPVFAGDSYSGASLSAQANYLHNGSIYQREKTPAVWKSVIASGVLASVWTPASGKTIRLMGGYVSSAANVSLLFEDNQQNGFVFRTPVLSADNPFHFELGNGVPMSGSNNVLKMTQIPNSPTTIVTGTLYGIEE
jgi:hypothetical protein